MAESEGTTKQEALKNQLLRQEILSKKDVVQLLQTYSLPEGLVQLDARLVSQHIRAVLNEMKKKQGAHDTSFVS